MFYQTICRNYSMLLLFTRGWLHTRTWRKKQTHNLTINHDNKYLHDSFRSHDILQVQNQTWNVKLHYLYFMHLYHPSRFPFIHIHTLNLASICQTTSKPIDQNLPLFPVKKLIKGEPLSPPKSALPTSHDSTTSRSTTRTLKGPVSGNGFWNRGRRQKTRKFYMDCDYQ